ncbi:MAG: hypothetical protein NVS3B21_08080 [Acidimicrobiales bacterium]
MVYAAVYAGGVRRTNIYLSETEQAALDARAAVEGSTRSDVVRALVDRELNLAEDTALDAALIRAAGDIADRSRRLSRTDPDLKTA